MIDLAHLTFTHFTIPPSIGSVSIPTAVPLPSWPVPQNPHHPHQTPSLSPSITNVVALQIQICQGRVVLQSFCQCLTADKDLQTTWWNNVKLKYKKSQRLLLHSSRTSSDTHISCGLQWNEKNELKFTQIPMIDLAHLPFTHFTIPPSTSSVWIPTAVPLPLMTGSSGSSPSSPNTKPEPQHHQCCWNPISSLSGSSCASVLPPKPHSKQRSAKYVVKSSKILWIHIQQILTPSTAFFSYFLSYSHVVSNEKNKLKFNQISMIDLAHLSTNPLCSLPFTHFPFD